MGHIKIQWKAVQLFHCLYVNIKNILLTLYYILFILNNSDTLSDYVPIYTDSSRDGNKVAFAHVTSYSIFSKHLLN